MSTYNASVPLSSDSPAIFPGQSQGNFTRLQAIISADHQFNLSAAANDGYHNIVHLTQQSPSGALAAIGRLYAKLVGTSVQLYYMDSAGVDYQITPQYDISVQKISGVQNLAALATLDVLNVAYDFTGFGTVFTLGTSGQTTYNFIRTGSTTYIQLINSNTGVNARPTLFFSGTSLKVKNESSIALNTVWSLMVNRL